jgi:hypothetical protein
MNTSEALNYARAALAAPRIGETVMIGATELDALVRAVGTRKPPAETIRRMAHELGMSSTSVADLLREFNWEGFAPSTDRAALRDTFAAAALQGLVSGSLPPPTTELVVGAAWQLADEMLAARGAT